MKLLVSQLLPFLSFLLMLLLALGYVAFVVVVVAFGCCVSFAWSSQRVLAGTDVASICGTTVVVAPIDEHLPVPPKPISPQIALSSNALFSIKHHSLVVAVLTMKHVAKVALLPHYIHFENPGFISSGALTAIYWS